jgi:hypothetical protein
MRVPGRIVVWSWNNAVKVLYRGRRGTSYMGNGRLMRGVDSDSIV